MDHQLMSCAYSDNKTLLSEYAKAIEVLQLDLVRCSGKDKWITVLARRGNSGSHGYNMPVCILLNHSLEIY